MEIGCANSRCPFGSGKPLPVLTVDEAIYRRLPAFLIATVDKFAGLPSVDKVGAFFDHVDREDEQGFYGAAEPGVGRKLFGGAVMSNTFHRSRFSILSVMRSPERERHVRKPNPA
jgi:hypothetical protein